MKSENGTSKLNSYQAICLIWITILNQSQRAELATANDDFTKFFPLYNLIPQPDLCIFLYADVETALDRISKKNIPKTFYETYDGLTAITNRYKEYIKYESYPIITIQSKDVLLEVSGLMDQKFNVEDMKKPV